MKDNISQKMVRSKVSVFLYFLILVFSFLAIFPIITVRAAPYTDVSVNIAYDMINNHTQYPDLIILDVRDKNEYDLSHLNNSILIPIGDINTRINELELYKDTEIIVYCGSDTRSTSASQNLAGNHNFTKIFNMLGGIKAWIDADYPVIEGNIQLPTIDFSFTSFITFLLGTIVVLFLYIKKRGYKK